MLRRNRHRQGRLRRPADLLLVRGHGRLQPGRGKIGRALHQGYRRNHRVQGVEDPGRSSGMVIDTYWELNPTRIDHPMPRYLPEADLPGFH